MLNPFAETLMALTFRRHNRLSFEEQCAYYAALRLGVPAAAVCDAAKITQATASILRRAGQSTNRGGRMPYPRVAREYENLGHERFVAKYITPIIRDRLDVAMKHHHDRLQDGAPSRFSPRAQAFCGRHEWLKTSIGLHAVFYVELIPDRGGYFWRDLKPFQDRPEIPVGAAQLIGDPDRDGQGYKTSEACFRFCRKRFSPTPAEIDAS